MELPKSFYAINTVMYKPDLDDEDLEEGDLERILYNYCDIDLDQFYFLIEKLLPLCEHTKSELTGITYRGFGKDGVWLIKQEI